MLNALRLGLVDLFINKAADHAGVNENVSLLQGSSKTYLRNFTNAVLRTAIRQRNSIKPPNEESATKNYPAWLLEMWRQQFGDQITELICLANDRPTNFVTLRVNQNKTTTQQLASKLKDWCKEIEPGQYCPHALVCIEPGSLDEPEIAKLWDDGQFYIQNESAQLASIVLNPSEGDKILDLCSAPGGKATHLAEMVGPSGKVLAVDSSAHRLEKVQANAKRLGHSHIETLMQDVTNLDKGYIEQSDCVMLDAPCSSLGVIRKAPEIRLLQSPESIARLAKLQRDMLEGVLDSMAGSSRLVYSVCTTTQAETFDHIDAICKRSDIKLVDLSTNENPVFDRDMVKDGCLQVTPARPYMDGYFVALVEKHSC